MNFFSSSRILGKNLRGESDSMVPYIVCSVIFIYYFFDGVFVLGWGVYRFMYSLMDYLCLFSVRSLEPFRLLFFCNPLKQTVSLNIYCVFSRYLIWQILGCFESPLSSLPAFFCYVGELCPNDLFFLWANCLFLIIRYFSLSSSEFVILFMFLRGSAISGDLPKYIVVSLFGDYDLGYCLFALSGNLWSFIYILFRFIL